MYVWIIIFIIHVHYYLLYKSNVTNHGYGRGYRLILLEVGDDINIDYIIRYLSLFFRKPTHLLCL